MNQLGFVEIAIEKNDRIFRAQLPLGVAWSEAADALEELVGNIREHVRIIEEQQANEVKE
jgi:hypothetical protein